MITCRIIGAGIIAPGLINWQEAHPVLAGTIPYSSTPLPRLNPSRLPANERRRTNAAVRLALEAADQAILTAGIDPARTATVFTSAGGDNDVIHGICQALCASEPALSPIAFHNSVHNAPAGYWSIATGDTLPYTALSALDGSVAMGLIEAGIQVIYEGGPVLFVAYEVPMPFPLNTQRPAETPFACALVLDQAYPSAMNDQIWLDYDDPSNETLLNDPELEALRRDNAAARVLPLLTLLAMGQAGEITLPLHEGRGVRLRYNPC